MFDVFLSEIAAPERIGSVLIAMLMVGLIGFMTGPSGGNANPFMWYLLEKICGKLIRKTYNTERSVASLRFRGAILLMLYLIVNGIIAAAAILIEQHFHLSGYMDSLLVALTLSGGATWYALLRLHHALRADGKKGAGSFYEIAVSTRVNLNSTDDHGIIRTAVGFVATNFDKALVAPIFWYLIGGLPALYLYTGIAAARWSMSKDGFAKGIGNLALKLETVFGFIPQMITTCILALAALMTPSAGMTRSLRGVFARSGAASYAEGGMPLTALAWALGVSLGGPVEDVHGSVLKRSWVGPSTASARLERVHLRHAVYLSIMGYLLVAAILIGGLVLWRMGST